MPDAPTKQRPIAARDRVSTRPAPSTDRDAGPARATRDRSPAPTAVAPALSILTPEDFRTIGSTLNGDHWQADIASLIGCSKSQVTRYLNRSRALSPLISRQLQFVIIERIGQLVNLLDLPGMPDAGSPEVTEARLALVDALAPLYGQEPPRDR